MSSHCQCHKDEGEQGVAFRHKASSGNANSAITSRASACQLAGHDFPAQGTVGLRRIKKEAANTEVFRCHSAEQPKTVLF